MNELLIFVEVLKIENPDHRLDKLSEMTAGNPELRARVEELLDAHARASHFMATSHHPVAAGNPTSVMPPAEEPGMVIGPYKLLQEIGEGGMGSVFMAEQTKPVQRRVALKIIKAGMDTRQVIARFEAERQALALMDHPNIAKVLDAGTTSVGRPYFVMELVKGVPITKYCDDKHLNLKDRLELFIQVCQAIQHAHQKGIIHRDIKPSNVLVAQYDGKPVPKVIDFGVAKATAQKLTEKTMFTEFGMVIGTVEYMSPEQAEVNQLDIDTRSDVYSLGVLLYELLTGTTPLESKKLRSVAHNEMLRLIREEEPSRPSIKLSTNAALPNIAASRGTDSEKLKKSVQGELDWIVMKTLEKDRARRYGSATDLSEDVLRFLNDETVKACPPSRAYQFQKFFRRNKGIAATGALVAAALLVATVGLGLGLIQAQLANRRTKVALENAEIARQKAEKAEAEAFGLLQTSTDEVIKKLIGAKKELTAIEIDYVHSALERWKEFADRQGKDERGLKIKSEGYLQIGTLWRTLGKVDEAKAAFSEAMRLKKELNDRYPEHIENGIALAMAQQELAAIYVARDEIPAAKEQVAAACKTWTELLPRITASEERQQREYVAGQIAMGETITKIGRPAGTNPLLEEARKKQVELISRYPTDPKETFVLAKILHQMGNSQDAHWRLQDLVSKYPNELEYLDELIKVRTSDAYLPPSSVVIDPEVYSSNLRRLIAEYPSRIEYAVELVNSLEPLLESLNKQEKHDRAEVFAAEAVEVLKKLAAQQIRSPLHRRKLGLALLTLARHQILQKKFNDANAAVLASQKNMESLTKDFPPSLEYEIAIALKLKEYAAAVDSVYSDNGPETIVAVDEALNRFRTFVKNGVKDSRVLKAYDDCLYQRAWVATNDPDLERAISLVRECVAAGGRSDCMDEMLLARCLINAKKLDEALELIRESIKVEENGNVLAALALTCGMGAVVSEEKELRNQYLDVAMKLAPKCRKITAESGTDNFARSQINQLGVILWRLDQFDKAVEVLERLAEDIEKPVPDTDFLKQRVAINLVVNYHRNQQIDKAQKLIEVWLPRLEKEEWAKSPLRRNLTETAAEVASDRGDLPRAEALYRVCLEGDRTLAELPKDDKALSLVRLGLVLLHEQKWTDAEPYLEECFRLRQEFQPEDWSTFNAELLLGEALLGQKKSEVAEEHLHQGYSGVLKRKNQLTLEVAKANVKKTLERISALKRTAGEDAEAQKWLERINELEGLEASKRVEGQTAAP